MVLHNISNVAKSSVLGIALAAVVASPAYACCPVGSINKSVEDITTSSALVDANTNSTALSVNSGDTLEYVITIKNSGNVEANGDDDMLNTVMTDTLPSGIELVSNPTQTTITDNVGTVGAGKSVSLTYDVKVTSTDNGAYITNRATYTAKSVNNQDNQSGCDVAVVQVTVPVAPTPTPTPTPTPVAPTTPVVTTPTATVTTPTALPNTGPGNIIIPAVIVSVLGYVAYSFKLKRNASRA
jgi:uncharacterized repeat protein (TIGR01451 family)